MIRDTSGQDRLVEPKSNWGKKAGIPIGLVALAAATWFWSPWQAEASLSANSLRFGEVKQGLFERAVNATGRVVASHSPALYSAATGRVRLLKKPGDKVAEGELIANISSPVLDNQLKQEENRLESSMLDLERMKLEVEQRKLALNKTLDLSRVNHRAAARELQRAEASFNIKVVSEFDYAKAKDDLHKAELDLKNAEREANISSDMIDFELKASKVSLAKQQLVVDELRRKQQELELRSPVSGMIGNWLVTQDSQVAEHQSLLTVVDLSAYEAELEIPQSFADDLAPGMTVKLNVAGKKYAAELRSVSPEVQNNHVIARVVFLDNKLQGLRQNQHLSARISLARKENTLYLPRGSYLEANNAVFLVEDGIATKTTVRFGARSIDQVEVLSGLKQGDRIITSSVDEFIDHETLFVNE
ncbi:efflux RND transporter periplasmic adaptor subunit [uncultured Pseudoteredinibacter sp.]|uniref:efflux RND transporter periplasmic adaptor subunit n=1 Tax=uncultured Pseudoteredinibacter sp. TaxID=1641701 RepID=UPI002609F078|nr:efflux RND transporter periplasmic adaptor subunit [uncultured Pseudoteredinibacter sp.]